jgi:hypothetical protein
VSIPALLVWRLVAGALPIDAGADGIVEVAWRGCRAERSGPLCVTGKGDELVLWTRLHNGTSDGTPGVCGAGSLPGLAGRGHTTVATGPDDGGCWTQLRVDDPSGVLELHGSDGRLLWSLPFAVAPTRDPTVEQAKARFMAGDDAEARRLLHAALNDPKLRDGDPLGLAGALDLDQQMAFLSDDFRTGLASAEAARDLYRSLGWISSACDITYALVHHHWAAHHDHAAARSALQAGARCVAELPRYAVHQRHAHAMLVEGQGDPLDTWLAYRDVDVLARRLRDHDFEAGILSAQHVVAEQMHQREDAGRIERRVDILATELAGSQACGLTNALSNLGWSVLMRRERGEPTNDPRPVLTTVRKHYQAGRCRSVDDFHNATINLALAELQHDDPKRARALLASLKATPHDPEGELWRHLILARAGLAQRDFSLASTHSTELDALARLHADPYFGWHAAVTRGALYAVKDQPDAASTAYQEAEALRDEMALPLALGAGHELAGVRWDHSASELIKLQIAQQRPAAAMRTARLARRRALRAVEALAAITADERAALAVETRRLREDIDAGARGDHRRTGAELERVYQERRQQRMALRRKFDLAAPGHSSPSIALREPTAGELVLVYYPLDDGWVGFAADGKHVDPILIKLPAGISDEALGVALYEPFAELIAAAAQVRIIATGALLARDLHGLPFEDSPLFTHLPVAYALDLARPQFTPPRPITGGLVVAANPGGEVPRLRFVAGETEDVAEQWAQLGLVTTRLVGADATRPAVLREYPRTNILHFIGHHLQRPEAARSTNAWDHELTLEGGTSLAVEDVLVATAASMPRVVFLSACQTGMIDPEVASGGVAIGHSFLLRGAELVIATARPVDDAEAARVAETFYRTATDTASLADPATLAEAQRDLLGEGSCSDHPGVCAYRAWVP